MLRYFFAFIFAILIATSSAGFCGECGCIPQSKLEKATNFLENIVHKYPIELVLAFSAAIMVGASVFFTCIDGHNSQNTRRSRKTDASQMQFWEHLRRVDYFNMQANHFNAQLEEMRRASANSY